MDKALENLKKITQDWQIYRSTVNNKVCLFSVNLAIARLFDEAKISQVIQFSLPYKVDKSNSDGLPNPQQACAAIDEMGKIITQVGALPDTLYAGHIIGNGKNEIYFYTNHTNDVKEVLSHFEDIREIKEQNDPSWSIYFDFLLPSELDIKLQATEDMVESLKASGDDLTEPRPVQHAFYFKSQQSLQRFIDNYHTNFSQFFDLQYGEENLAKEGEDDRIVYIAILTNEMTLDDQSIFHFVEQLNILAGRFDGEYIGWVSNDKKSVKHIH